MTPDGPPRPRPPARPSTGTRRAIAARPARGRSCATRSAAGRCTRARRCRRRARWPPSSASRAAWSSRPTRSWSPRASWSPVPARRRASRGSARHDPAEPVRRQRARPRRPCASTCGFDVRRPLGVPAPRVAGRAAPTRCATRPIAALRLRRPAGGAASLRAALAAYLGRARGVVGRAARIVVTHRDDAGRSALLARALRARGRAAVAVEDPGFPIHRMRASSATGLRARAGSRSTTDGLRGRRRWRRAAAPTRCW